MAGGRGVGGSEVCSRTPKQRSPPPRSTAEEFGTERRTARAVVAVEGRGAESITRAADTGFAMHWDIPSGQRTNSGRRPGLNRNGRQVHSGRAGPQDRSSGRRVLSRVPPGGAANRHNPSIPGPGRPQSLISGHAPARRGPRWAELLAEAVGEYLRHGKPWARVVAWHGRAEPGRQSRPGEDGRAFGRRPSGHKNSVGERWTAGRRRGTEPEAGASGAFGAERRAETQPRRPAPAGARRLPDSRNRLPPQGGQPPNKSRTDYAHATADSTVRRTPPRVNVRCRAESGRSVPTVGPWGPITRTRTVRTIPSPRRLHPQVHGGTTTAAHGDYPPAIHGDTTAKCTASTTANARRVPPANARAYHRKNARAVPSGHARRSTTPQMHAAVPSGHARGKHTHPQSHASFTSKIHGDFDPSMHRAVPADIQACSTRTARATNRASTSFDPRSRASSDESIHGCRHLDPWRIGGPAYAYVPILLRDGRPAQRGRPFPFGTWGTHSRRPTNRGACARRRIRVSLSDRMVVTRRAGPYPFGRSWHCRDTDHLGHGDEVIKRRQWPRLRATRGDRRDDAEVVGEAPRTQVVNEDPTDCTPDRRSGFVVFEDDDGR